MSRLALTLVLLLALVGCKARIVPVDVHHYHRDSIATIQRDTILQVDSVIIKQVGDTVYIRETSDRIRATSEERSKSLADSVSLPPQLTPTPPPEPPPNAPSHNTSPLLLLSIGALIPISLYVTYRIAKK
nr:MAG TPA: hypothetical protein [Caudoviricetes sp.]